MAIATKRKPSAHARKRQANHHRRSKRYGRVYLPYLPMFAIVGSGALINQVWTVSQGTALAASSNFASQTRLSSMTGNSSLNLLYVALTITFVAFALFVLTHWYRLHRMLNRGEDFVVHHPWFDIGLITIVTAGVLLTRA